MKNYRADNRSKEQFEKDIFERTLKERELFKKWIALREKEEGRTIEWNDFAVGNDGRPLQKVNSQPDFEIVGEGLVESKFAFPMLKDNFHLKVGQVDHYIKLNASVLMVNGAETPEPEFTILRPETLKEIQLWSPKVRWFGFGNKLAYRISVSKLIWRKLNV